MSVMARELPMPNVSRIYSLTQAHATLLHCRNRLTTFAQSCARQDSMKSPKDTRDERRQYQFWLQRWEEAFTEYLSAAMTSMSSEDLTQSRLLKANHLASTIVAADIKPDGTTVERFDTEFQAIVELADAVLQLRQRPDSPQSATSSESSATSQGLDVRHPLLVVMARCHHKTICHRATELVLRCNN